MTAQQSHDTYSALLHRKRLTESSHQRQTIRELLTIIETGRPNPSAMDRAREMIK